MTIRIDGTNTAANPGITGTDTDTGLQFGTNEVNVVTGGSTRATVDSSGRVLVGTTSNFVRGDLQVVAGGGGEITIARNDDSVVAGNDIGHFYFATNDSGTGVTCAQIECYAEHDHTASSASTNLRFNTTAQGATTSTEAVRIDSSQNLRFNSGYGSVATAYGCRAWVNFNGTGTVSIRDSGNVSSITDVATGKYRVNFSTNMPDSSYAAVAQVIKDDTADNNDLYATIGATGVSGRVPISSYVPITTTRLNTALVDSPIVNVVIVR